MLGAVSPARTDRPARGARVAPAVRPLAHSPTLDGARGASWLAVFVAHAGLVHDLALGQVAMFVFFGLSGFLITSLLLGEHARSGRISLLHFFARRALRLWPALVLFLAVWVAVVAVFGHHAWVASVPGARRGQGVALVVALEAAGAALAYLTNWFDVFHLFSGYVPLGHLWSLAVEEQLYLLWAPLVALVLARAWRWALAASAALALGSFLDVLVLHRAPGISTWVYRGTDTRMGTFLVGGALAVAWAGPLARSRTWARATRVVPAAALAVLAWSAWEFGHPGSAGLTGVAWVACSVAGPVLVVAVLDRHRHGGRSVLAGALPGYLGRRSYALYLWHYVWLTWPWDGPAWCAPWRPRCARRSSPGTSSRPGPWPVAGASGASPPGATGPPSPSAPGPTPAGPTPRRGSPPGAWASPWPRAERAGLLGPFSPGGARRRVGTWSGWDRSATWRGPPARGASATGARPSPGGCCSWRSPTWPGPSCTSTT